MAKKIPKAWVNNYGNKLVYSNSCYSCVIEEELSKT